MVRENRESERQFSAPLPGGSFCGLPVNGPPAGALLPSVATFLAPIAIRQRSARIESAAAMLNTLGMQQGAPQGLPAGGIVPEDSSTRNLFGAPHQRVEVTCCSSAVTIVLAISGAPQVVGAGGFFVLPHADLLVPRVVVIEWPILSPVPTLSHA